MKCTKYILVLDRYGDVNMRTFNSKPTQEELREVIEDDWCENGEEVVEYLTLYKVSERFDLETTRTFSITGDDC